MIRLPPLRRCTHNVEVVVVQTSAAKSRLTMRRRRSEQILVWRSIGPSAMIVGVQSPRERERERERERTRHGGQVKNNNNNNNTEPGCDLSILMAWSPSASVTLQVCTELQRYNGNPCVRRKGKRDDRKVSEISH